MTIETSTQIQTNAGSILDNTRNGNQFGRSQILQSRSSVRYLDVLSEGQIEGFYNRELNSDNPNDCIQYGGTLIRDFDFNEGPSIKTQFSSGASQGQSLILFSNAENTVSTGRTEPILFDGNPFTFTASQNTDAIRMNISFPRGLFRIDSDGDTARQWARIQVTRRTNGGASEVVQFENYTEGQIDPYIYINGITSSPFAQSVLINRPRGSTGSWTVEVTNVREERSSNATNEFTIDFYTEIQYLPNQRYEDISYMAHILPAGILGSTATTERQVHVRGIRMAVPTNYNSNGVSVGAWDGKFKESYSNNPIWIALDLILNGRYGLGEHFDLSKIDIFSFYEAAEYCNDIVDGERRFTFNGVITVQGRALDTIQQVLSLCWATVAEINGKLTIIQDRPLDAVRLLNNDDVVNSEFVYTGVDISTRTTSVNITYNEPENEYKPETFTVSDDKGIARFLLNEETVALFGCTSRKQAERHARYMIDTAVNQGELISFGMSFNSFGLNVGSVVNIFDEHDTGVIRSWKIVSIEDAGEGIFNVTALIYDNGKYARIQNVNSKIFTPEIITNTADRVSGPVRNLRVEPRFVSSGDDVLNNRQELFVTWDQPSTGLIGGYEITWTRDINGDDPLIPNTFGNLADGVGNSIGTSFIIPEASPSRYRIAVRPISRLGVRGQAITIEINLDRFLGDGNGASDTVFRVSELSTNKDLPLGEFDTCDLHVNWRPDGETPECYVVSYRDTNGVILREVVLDGDATSDTLTFVENFSALN